MNVFRFMLIFACACFLSCSARAASPAGPLAQWKFDEGQGDVTRDASGYKRDAKVFGIDWVKQGDGFAASFDGTDDYISFDDGQPLALQGPITVAAWVKPTRKGDGRLACLLGQDLHSYLLGFAGDVCYWYIGAGANHVGAIVQLNQWSHIVGTFDGERMALWLNGRLMYEKVSKYKSYDKRDRFMMATKGRPDLPKFKGLIDDVRVYGRALSEKEIVAHATAGADQYGITVPPKHGPAVHYTFEKDGGDVVKDVSGYGNDAQLVNAEYLQELDGRRGVLRFDGKQSLLTVAKSDSARFEGDLSFEMWVRRNGPMTSRSGKIFGDNGVMSFYHSDYITLTLWYGRRNEQMQANESMLMPLDRDLFADQWTHVAVAFEYPRCKVYQNGKLFRDAYMPFPGIAKSRLARVIGENMPMDLDEFRYYRRALTAAEVAAHAADQEAALLPETTLAVEPHWYDNTLTLRLNSKGRDLTGHTVRMSLLGVGDMRATAPVTESSERSGRFVASVKFPLADVAGKSLTAEARVLSPNGTEAATVQQQASIVKPDWVHTREGYTDKVLPPWTPLEAQREADGAIEVRVWGRRYRFGSSPFPPSIETDGHEILSSPVALTGRCDGADVAWENSRTELLNHTHQVATLKHHSDSERLTLTVDTLIEFDGYMIFDCALTARRDVTVNQLRLDVPFHARFAALCYADAVFPETKTADGMTNYLAMDHSGAVRGDQAFRFTPTAWLGDGTRGLCWQAESDEFWRNADEQKAIELLQREKTTTFRAHFVDVETPLKKGDVLRYKFALQATPIKKKLRDAWDLRMVRLEPYGDELRLPDMLVDGKPALDALAEAGVRSGAYMVCDLWPYPMPVQEKFSRLLKRFNKEMHARGMKAVGYQMHPRFPTAAPEFDIHGLHMANLPMKPYGVGGAPAGTPRPGPVNIDYGSPSQGPVYDCPKSMALQDANIHSFAMRMDTHGDDGVYLDGRNISTPCKNTLHGCGYRDADGKLHETHPIFAAREIMRRIYTVVKTRMPDGVVDAHTSYQLNIPALAYADMLWSGEQWWHLKKTSGPEDKYTAGVFPLDMCRVEFTGEQAGVAGNALGARLGYPYRIAATTLLHDVPPRPSSSGHFSDRTDLKRWMAPLYPSIWKMRDKFDAPNARKLFYYENQVYVSVSPDKCYATLLHHPDNGVIALISNLSRDKQDVTVEFNLDRLGLAGKKLEAVNGLTEEAVEISPSGALTASLGSEDWIYVWLRPKASQ